jgi:hypothetical protein
MIENTSTTLETLEFNLERKFEKGKEEEFFSNEI